MSNKSDFMGKFCTPESRFNGLKDYPFQPHYFKTAGVQIHYLDEGPADSDPILLLHGVPAWSYLYRHMIKSIAAVGNRVIAPDLIGFGKSDKPQNIEFYSCKVQVDCITRLLDILDLKNIIMFGHDWGSLIGLRIVADHPELFSAIIISNGMLPTGEQKIHSKFKLWKNFARYSPVLPVDLVIASEIIRKLDKEEKAAYRAPFPSSKYKAGIRAMPGLIPLKADDPEANANRLAWESLKEWKKPFLTLFSTRDTITYGADDYMQQRIPGAAGQDHKRFDARHFIQEDCSSELADTIIRFNKKISTEYIT